MKTATEWARRLTLQDPPPKELVGLVEAVREEMRQELVKEFKEMMIAGGNKAPGLAFCAARIRNWGKP